MTLSELRDALDLVAADLRLQGREESDTVVRLDGSRDALGAVLDYATIERGPPYVVELLASSAPSKGDEG